MRMSDIGDNLQTLIFKTLLTFALIFNLSFSIWPELTTGRIAFSIMLVLYGRELFNFFVSDVKQSTFFVACLYVLFFVAFVWWLVNSFEDSILLSRIFWFVVFSYISSLFYACVARYNLSAFLTYYLLAMLLQAFFVFLSVVSSSFHSWVIDHLAGSNIDFHKSFVRFPGLTNGGGAQASVQLSLGVIAAYTLFLRSTYSFNRLLLLMSAFIITLATLFVGRTGFLVSLCCFVGFIFSARSYYISLLLLLFFTALIFNMDKLNLLTTSAWYVDGNYNVNLEHTFRWAFQLFLDGDTGTADALFSMLSSAPELSDWGYVIGTGRITTPEGFNYSGHDSGYIQLFYALGLPLTLFFYLSLLYFCLKKTLFLRNSVKVNAYLLIMLMFILELKEPFIFKYSLSFFVFSYLYLAAFETSKKYKPASIGFKASYSA